MRPFLNAIRSLESRPTEEIAYFLCLFFLGLLTPSSNIAQTSLTDTLSTEDLDYYLVQAFNADRPTNRQSINHLGIEGTILANGVAVTGVLEGYPAHDVGIRRGDIILTINGKPFHPVLTLNPGASRQIFEPDLTPVSLRYLRNNITRTSILDVVYENLYDSYRTATFNSVLQFNSGNKVIGYVRLWAISRSTNDLSTFREILSNLDQCDGIILDLRSGYGFLDYAHFASFLSYDEMKSTLGKDTFNENTSVNTALISGEIESSGSLTYRRPLGILIDSQTSGSSAFFASALAQLNRTVVIGDTSAGKFGTFHENKKITRPNGERIFLYHPGPYGKQYEFVNEGRGLIPDQKVLFPFNKNIAGDIQFDTAVLTLLSII